MFSAFALESLIIAALVGTGLGVVVLLSLLFRDYKKKQLW